jgi:hypothetical protein
MGGGFDENGFMVSCEGKAVIDELNKVFGDPGSDRYKQAQAVKEKFGAIVSKKNNFNDLIDAYNAAGVTVDDGWRLYLTLLGRAQPQGPDNIYLIAQARYNGLKDGDMMETVVHVPQHGGHVHTHRGTKAGLVTQIDSPCPMPGSVKDY